jgi:PPOX class probable F420-dependent enzyme
MNDEDLIAELLDGPYPCCLSTLRADGSPYSVVVWCGRDGDRVTVNAAEGRWLENVRRDPRVSLTVVDTANILRHVGVDGVVVAIEPDEHYGHLDELSRTYMSGKYQWSTPDEEPRFKVVIEPKRIRAIDIPLPDAEIR